MDTELGQRLDGATIRLSADDRRRHIYLVGKSGTGKSTLLLNLMAQDFAAERGFALLDPHGDLAEAVADLAPLRRIDHVVYLDPSDLARPVGFNVLDNVADDRRALVASRVVSSLQAIWGDSWGPRMEYILYNSLRLLLDNRSTLLALPKLLADAAYRAALLRKCQDPVIRHFWTDEFDAYNERFRQEAIAPVQNKIGALLASPTIRNIVGQQHSTFNLSHLMNRRKVLIANLSKGRLGEFPSHLLGALLVSGFAQAAEERASMAEDDRQDFTLYVDEFQNFATDAFATILSEARKWRLSLVLAHQFLGQMPPRLRQAVIGNAGTLISFRIGAEDAPLLAGEFGLHDPGTMDDPTHLPFCERGLHTPVPLSDSPNFTAWVKLMQRGEPSLPHRLLTFPPARSNNSMAAIRARTRACHTRPREKVQQDIERFLAS